MVHHPVLPSCLVHRFWALTNEPPDETVTVGTEGKLDVNEQLGRIELGRGLEPHSQDEQALHAKHVAALAGSCSDAIAVNSTAVAIKREVMVGVVVYCNAKDKMAGLGRKWWKCSAGGELLQFFKTNSKQFITTLQMLGYLPGSDRHCAVNFINLRGSAD